MTTICSVFGVFSAFGAAILAFFTAGGGLGRLSTWLEVREKYKGLGARRAKRLGHTLVWLVAGVVAFAVIISGLGLFTSFSDSRPSPTAPDMRRDGRIRSRTPCSTWKQWSLRSLLWSQ
jgi:hypothetical protein